MAETLKRYELRLPHELVVAVEEFRARQRPVPSAQQALQRLIRTGLEVAGLVNAEGSKKEGGS